ncbi:phage GP46 family protein [Ignatzschineria cameli]|uniref:Phage GP46 family protein n=1 Tax=Ignatzschineria cameli TaxID=2182793 RepID=A0A2U2AQS7_9GAMM|nr:phage GP46 family protein [Ignatzschineria cameli]PWD86219.1 hypothetical protein DC077_05620 [Ignatzschineria cameli]PWD88666.1 hypothetical protein DC079_08985 [Ignatzschineria cameli]PWD89530.1 hypothetical protein DC081_08755 [Ignatzschineria cameli]PWD90155.1 hypothetical protein DC078_08690 [Ignatzschineria cameli]
MDRLIDPKTGDYYNDQRVGNSLENAVYVRLETPKGTYWADAELGSLLHTLQREKNVSRVRLLAIQYAEEALQPILDERRAKTIDVDATQANGSLLLHITVVDIEGKRNSFNHLVPII